MRRLLEKVGATYEYSKLRVIDTKKERRLGLSIMPPLWGIINNLT